ncbi:MAG: hypothetical protein AAB434_05300 [Planctomycetota bacterium]
MEPVPRWERDPPRAAGTDVLEVRRVLARWFVQYNPLYFASALCILVGIYLVSTEIQGLRWRSERLLLVGVLEAYQALVLAGAALLLHVARQRRPAVILALLELPFLFDWTFQMEALSTLARVGPVASVAWVVLAIAKAIVLLRLFRVRLRPVGALVMLGGLAYVAALPQVLASSTNPFGIHLAATWALALLLGALAGFRQVVGCFLVLDDWGRTVQRRALRAAGSIGAGLGLLHLAAAASQFGVRLGPAHAAPFVLIVALLARDEVVAWIGAVVAFALTAGTPEVASPVAAAMGLLLLGCAHAWGRPRLHVAAIALLALSAQLAGWSPGHLPPLVPWVWGLAGCALAWVGWRAAVRLAWAASVASLLLGGSPWAHLCVPGNRLEWGLALLGAGFLWLVLGVAVNWAARRREPEWTRGTDPGPRPVDLGL